MSLILDALRQSKQQEGPTSVADPLSAVATPPAKGYPVGIMVLVVGVMLGAAVAVLWQLGVGQTTESPQLIAPSSALAVEQKNPELSDSAGRKKHSTGTLVELSSGSSGISEMAPAASREVKDMPRSTSDYNEQSADREQIVSLHRQMWEDAQSGGYSQTELLEAQAVTQVERNAGATIRQVRERQSIAPPVDLAKAMENAARELGESALSPHPVPLLENLSQQQKDRIPTIVYTDHDYSTQGTATVELNGKRLRAQQRAEGITVLEILSDSVILSVQGTEFRLKALNTWVNL